MSASELRRGFRAECNAWAREFRDEFGLWPHDPLCPWRLSEHLEVPVLDLKDLEPCSEQAYLLTGKGQGAFSAAVLYRGLRASVLLNGAHSRKRLASSLAHELAHVVLHHPPRPLFVAACGTSRPSTKPRPSGWGPPFSCRREAACHAHRLIQAGAATLEEMSDRWVVTKDVTRMRMNVVGASRRHQRSASASG